MIRPITKIIFQVRKDVNEDTGLLTIETIKRISIFLEDFELENIKIKLINQDLNSLSKQEIIDIFTHQGYLINDDVMIYKEYVED